MNMLYSPYLILAHASLKCEGILCGTATTDHKHDYVYKIMNICLCSPKMEIVTAQEKTQPFNPLTLTEKDI